MDQLDTARLRLANQQVTVHTGNSPQQVVRALGGIQAQDFRSALWAIGLRLPDAVRPDVEQACTDASIVRTWAMRGTLHFISSADVRWMIALLAPGVIAASAHRRRQLEIDSTTLARSRDVLTGALSHRRVLARDEAMRLLEGAGIQTTGQRGIHILRHLALEGTLCQTAFEGTQATFVLLDEWVPKSEAMSRDAALAELAHRYFASHGPATLRDFGWWAGLSVADAKAGLDWPRLNWQVRRSATSTTGYPPARLDISRPRRQCTHFQPLTSTFWVMRTAEQPWIPTHLGGLFREATVCSDRQS